MSAVAFFGGSFDPPHFGHVLAAAYARGQGFERVVVAPVSQHAFGKRLTAFAHRLAMARIAFEPVREVEVSGIEAELSEPSFTLNTLRALAERNPHWRLRLLIGSDVLADVAKWNRFEEVRALAPPYVLERAGVSAGGVLPEISSTAVRNALLGRAGDAGADAFLRARVPEGVLGYIEREKLYSSGPT